MMAVRMCRCELYECTAVADSSACSRAAGQPRVWVRHPEQAEAGAAQRHHRGVHCAAGVCGRLILARAAQQPGLGCFTAQPAQIQQAVAACLQHHSSGGTMQFWGEAAQRGHICKGTILPQFFQQMTVFLHLPDCALLVNKKSGNLTFTDSVTVVWHPSRAWASHILTRSSRHKHGYDNI